MARSKSNVGQVVTFWQPSILRSPPHRLLPTNHQRLRARNTATTSATPSLPQSITSSQFRADLDIAGTLNTLSHINISPYMSSSPWDQPEHATRNTIHLTTTPVDTERALNWHTDDFYVALNNDSENAWGEKRGYRIMPGTMPGTMPGVPAHLAIINSTALGNSARWAESDLFVLRRHDDEIASSVPESSFSPEDPRIDFNRMLNDEFTIQEDLVVYFNLGNHYVPTI